MERPPLGRSVVVELIEEKMEKVLRDLPKGGEVWRVQHAFFAHSEFTEAARAEAEAVGAQLVNLAQLDADLRGTAPHPA